MTINIREYIEDLDLHDGVGVRSDCPICNGNNSFTATKIDSAISTIKANNI